MKNIPIFSSPELLKESNFLILFKKKLTNSSSGIIQTSSGACQPLLGKLYGLFKKKRTTRNEFLNSVMKLFEFIEPIEVDVGLTKYLAENFSAFNYNIYEELYYVIHCIHRIITLKGSAVLSNLKALSKQIFKPKKSPAKSSKKQTNKKKKEKRKKRKRNKMKKMKPKKQKPIQKHFE